MTMQEIYDTLKPQGCVSLYRVGSCANPYIKSPRDEEYFALFNSEDELNSADNIHNVHKYCKEFTLRKCIPVWGYLLHYYNSSEHLGEDYTFPTYKLSDLVRLSKLKKSQYDMTVMCKNWYHLAMIDAINKYGYDDIPDDVAQYINDIHDLVKPYSEEIK